FVIECKNLLGNIEINNNGDFIRTFKYGNRTVKEGIYSPITQNRRHLELVKQIRLNEKNVIGKILFEKNFYNSYRSVVVLSNPRTILNARYAKKEIREQVIRSDQLAEYIRSVNKSSEFSSFSDTEMEALAEFFMSQHKSINIDYAETFRRSFLSASQKDSAEKKFPKELLCPKCGNPMVLRKATKGVNSGKEFYGCSNFPKCRGIININI
ncbi:MAG: topoisomerase DNA-binding C4 zinc finger domain-containing protein, partial [Oscillospiraceae bacterium]|nr:topoisomerase DNA-binding C4 zinc finger domain-containing protein [Oscillospiraceae bacterium]